MENGSRKIGLRVAAGFLVAITIIVAVFVSGITLPSQEDRTGRLTILLTDAPVDLDKLDITITALEVHKVGQDDEDGKWITLMDEDDEAITFDLLEYQNGKSLELVSVLIDAGTYNKIRMNVSEAYAYYKDGTEEDTGNPVSLTVPSGKIDVITKFTLENGGSRIVTIDMEPDWVSISKSNNLRPTLKATVSEKPAVPITNSEED